MDRKEFFVSLGKGTVAVCMACYLASCGQNSSSMPTAPTTVDFTLDLTQSNYKALNNIGQSIYKDGIVIARINATTIVAVSQYCTHQGTTIQYEPQNNRFHCSNHGSNFRTDGTVINGPAAQALVKYNTELNGETLRIYS